MARDRRHRLRKIRFRGRARVCRRARRHSLVLSFFPYGEAAEHPERRSETGFFKTLSEADGTLPDKIDAINLESNFRAERRVVVVDSLSGWLRASFARSAAQGTDDDAIGFDAAKWERTIQAILAFEGKIIAVTEEPGTGLAPSVRELEYAGRLADANRVLLRASHAVYRVTAGMAVELKGYRIQERNERK